MKEIIKTENIIVNEVEECDFDKWVKEEFKEVFPTTMIKKVFPKKVMDIISADHHKSKDGGFGISYDFYSGEWYITHSGYIREAEARGKNFNKVAHEFLQKIRRENDKVLYREIEAEANKVLPENYSVEISDNHITLYDYSDGWDNLRTISSTDCKNMNIKEIIKATNELLNDSDLF